MEVELAHVNVDIVRREVKGLVQVPVFDGVAAAAVEVAAAAVLAGWRSDALGSCSQVYAFSG